MESMVKKLKQKFKYESSRKKKEEKWFLENGSIFLKVLIADCNGKTIPIRRFSSSQIRKATSNFAHSFLIKDGADEWYKGIIEDKPYLIKKFSKYSDYVYNDIVLSARMSNHNNFLKLLGCCFEFSFPVILFEYVEYPIVDGIGHTMINGEKSILPWNVRLKIAKEIAIAITYLHTAFPRIIIHKDIKPSNIFLDKNWKAKLTDFKFSVTLPEGKSRLEKERTTGTIPFMDPAAMRGVISEYTDVFSFGICLLVFLTRKIYFDLTEEYSRLEDDVKVLYENGKLDEIIDPMIAKDITSSQRLQVEAFVMLALRCCKEREEERPKMIQVAKELKRIERNELSQDETSVIAFPKNELLEDEPCILKSTRKLKLD